MVNDGPVNEDSIGHVQGDGEDGLDGLEKADPGLLRQPCHAQVLLSSPSERTGCASGP